jgi:hypothetical protein
MFTDAVMMPVMMNVRVMVDLRGSRLVWRTHVELLVVDDLAHILEDQLALLDILQRAQAPPTVALTEHLSHTDKQ